MAVEDTFRALGWDKSIPDAQRIDMERLKAVSVEGWHYAIHYTCPDCGQPRGMTCDFRTVSKKRSGPFHMNRWTGANRDHNGPMERKRSAEYQYLKANGYKPAGVTLSLRDERPIGEFTSQDFDCLTCDALPGDPCTYLHDGATMPRGWVHKSRRDEDEDERGMWTVTPPPASKGEPHPGNGSGETGSW